MIGRCCDHTVASHTVLASFYSGRGEGMEAKKYADRLKTLTDN